MPDKKSIMWHYIQEVLAGHKKLLKACGIKVHVVSPKFNGIRIETMWEQVKANENRLTYFPDYLGR